MSDRAPFLALAIAMAFLPGCAGAGGGGPDPLSVSAHTLSEDEKGLDCRRLTGRVQVRLLALRGEDFKVAPSAMSEAMRPAASAALGTETAKNAAARAAADRPVLEAYNARLRELGCPSFNLDAELAARPSAPTPYPTIPGTKKGPKT